MVSVRRELCKSFKPVLQYGKNGFNSVLLSREDRIIFALVNNLSYLSRSYSRLKQTSDGGMRCERERKRQVSHCHNRHLLIVLYMIEP